MLIENESLDSVTESNRANLNRSRNDVFPVTALNRKTTPLFIPYNSQAEGKIISQEIIIDENILRSYRLVDKIESRAVKFDIHKSFKYLNGFLDIAPGEPPINEYPTSNCAYEYTQQILEVFTDLIINYVYKYDSNSNGEINANLTAQKLNIDFDSSIELEVKDIGESLYNLFKDYDNKKPKIEEVRELPLVNQFISNLDIYLYR